MNAPTVLGGGPAAPAGPSGSALSRVGVPVKSPAGAAKRASGRAGLLVALLTGLAVLIGPGTAYASGIDILPGGGRWVANTVAEAFAEIPVGVKVGAVATVAVAGAPVELSAAAVAAATLGTAAAVFAGWQLLSSVNWCLDCGKAAGPSASPSSATSFCAATCFANKDAQGVSGYPPGTTVNVQEYDNYNYTGSYAGVTDASGSYTHTSYPATWAGVSVNGMCVALLGSVPYAPCGGMTPAPPPPAGPTGQDLAVENTTTCTPAGGGAAVTSVTYSAAFKAANGYTTPPPLAPAGCAAGSVRTGYGARVVPLTPTGAPDTGASAPAPTVIVKPMTLPTAAPAGHPDWSVCMAGGSASPCELKLAKALPDGTVRPYVAATDWPIYDPAGDPTGQKVPPVWSCTWGPLSVVVTECKPVYLDPPTALPKPPGSSEACDGGGLSFSPASWVVVPFKCMFEPSPGAMQAAYGDASAGFTATGLPAWGSAFAGVGSGLAAFGGAGSAGCAGPHFSFTLAHHAYAFDPLNACAQPMQGVALVVKLFASLAVIVAGARLCARPVLTAFGMGRVV